YITGGVAGALLEFVGGGVLIESFEVGDCYPAHGKSTLVEQALHIDPASLAQRVLGSLKG
ncbi:hypothetical protein, partial [Helicobacter heilmannii]|uniref:hypothetical protein n=1 Tax=Helicobacter heilmannii TaxID=35817 RepID=UPI00131585EA